MHMICSASVTQLCSMALLYILYFNVQLRKLVHDIFPPMSIHVSWRTMSGLFSQFESLILNIAPSVPSYVCSIIAMVKHHLINTHTHPHTHTTHSIYSIKPFCRVAAIGSAQAPYVTSHSVLLSV